MEGRVDLPAAGVKLMPSCTAKAFTGVFGYVLKSYKMPGIDFLQRPLELITFCHLTTMWLVRGFMCTK